MDTFGLSPIGVVESPLVDPSQAPRQGDEGAPTARIVLQTELEVATEGIGVGDTLLVLTWLHLADRAVRRTRPRSDPDRAAVGVFATRSPDRPNPIGVHRVRVTRIDGCTLTVDGLEAVDGTPVLDLRPVLGGVDER